MARSPSLIADHTNHASCTRWAAPSYPPTTTVTRNRSDGAAQAGVAFRQVGSPRASSSVIPTEWAMKSPCAPRTTRTFGTLRMIDWSPMVRLQSNSSPSFRRNDCSGASRIDVPLSAKVTTRVSRAVWVGAAVACGLTTGVGGGEERLHFQSIATMSDEEQQAPDSERLEHAVSANPFSDWARRCRIPGCTLTR